MTRKVFAQFEAVSAVVPGDGAYSAAIAVKALVDGGAPRFHKILDGQRFSKAHEADQAASDRLQALRDVDSDGELVWD